MPLTITAVAEQPKGYICERSVTINDTPERSELLAKVSQVIGDCIDTARANGLDMREYRIILTVDNRK